MRGVILGRPDGDIANRVRIALDGFDALFIVADYDVGLDLAIRKGEVLQKQLQR